MQQRMCWIYAPEFKILFAISAVFLVGYDFSLMETTLLYVCPASA